MATEHALETQGLLEFGCGERQELLHSAFGLDDALLYHAWLPVLYWSKGENPKDHLKDQHEQCVGALYRVVTIIRDRYESLLDNPIVLVWLRDVLLEIGVAEPNWREIKTISALQLAVNQELPRLLGELNKVPGQPLPADENARTRAWQLAEFMNKLQYVGHAPIKPIY